MYIKRSLLSAGVLFIAISSISTNSIAQSNPNYHKSRTRPVIPYRHVTLAAPPGMVYVPGGSVTIKYSQSSTDTNSKKRVSLSSYYIDKTEVTNQQYRMFTEWVIDSIAVVNYLKDDKYFLDPPPGGYPDENNTQTASLVDTSTVAADSLMTSLGGEADIAGGGDDKTVWATDANGNLVRTKPDPTQSGSANPGASSAVTDADGNLVRRRINWDNVRHKDIFDTDDDEIKAKIAPMYDPVTGKIREELYVYNFTYLKATGTNKNVKYGEVATEAIHIYPDEKIWFKDLSNSQVDILVENYFTQPPFDDYPVVGVTWKQARAFAAWRSHTNYDYADIADYLKYYHLQYSLPSEAQWVYAAGKDIQGKKQPTWNAEPEPAETTQEELDSIAAAAEMTPETMSPETDSAALATAEEPMATEGEDVAMEEDEVPMTRKERRRNRKKNKNKNEDAEEDVVEGGTPVAKAEKDNNPGYPVDKDRDGNLLVNFKQEEGDYTEDGANFTLPVMSYAPNEYGVYNMVGNVAEWVLDAYSPSAFAFVSDVNPVLLYDATDKDAPAMRRKVVRGGSFVSNAKALSPFTRDFELQEAVHCYIGFRCVMSAPEILSKTVATRRKETGRTAPKSASKSSRYKSRRRK